MPVLTLILPGGGGMGREVIILTAALLSAEYHHSRNLREKTVRGSRLEVSHWRGVVPPVSCCWRDGGKSGSSEHLLRHRPAGSGSGYGLNAGRKINLSLVERFLFITL